jgi:hypothetical protein
MWLGKNAMLQRIVFFLGALLFYYIMSFKRKKKSLKAYFNENDEKSKDFMSSRMTCFNCVWTLGIFKGNS